MTDTERDGADSEDPRDPGGHGVSEEDVLRAAVVGVCVLGAALIVAVAYLLGRCC